MSKKFYFLKLVITTIFTPLLASLILVLPVMWLKGMEITPREAVLGIGLGYISVIPFLLFIYLPCIYFLSKKFFTLITFVLTALTISGLAGYIILMGIQEPLEWNPGAPPITAFQILSFVSVYASTGVLAAFIQFRFLSMWSSGGVDE